MGELALLTKDTEPSVTPAFPPDARAFLSGLAEPSHQTSRVYLTLYRAILARVLHCAGKL
jgi:hypothetical protein